MKMKLNPWVTLTLAGVCFAADTSDAEIVKDLDFFMTYDVIQNEAAMDDEQSEMDNLTDGIGEKS